MNIPEGWKLVPVEPTPEMLDARWKLLGDEHQPYERWEAMLAAAPTPPAQELDLSQEAKDWYANRRSAKQLSQEDEPAGYLCTHPTQPDRLIKHKKNAFKYHDLYVDGTVEISPVYTRPDTSELRKAAEEAYTVFEHAFRKEFQPRHIDRCEIALIKLRAALGKKS